MKIQFWAKASGARAEIFLYDYIGGGFFEEGITAKSVSDAMKEFTPGVPLDVYINSPGGAVFEGIAIKNILQRWTGKKTVHVDGIAASIASVIAMVGDEILMASASMMMIHEPFGMAMGTADDCRKVADALDKVHGVILDTYVSRTGGDAKKIDAMMRAESWLTADEAVAQKFATSKTEDQALKAEFPLLSKFKNTPQSLRRGSMQSQSLLARMQMRTATMNRGPAARAAG